jgi:4-amino-4-deoxy-L-arabinose transferase-like glycosyltransferase
MNFQQQPNELPAQNERNTPFWRRPVAVLLLILFLAAFLRLVNFGQSPPGLNPDEAANAWSAYCLLKTGKDYAGVSWPIYYTRNLGGNSSTLYVYLLLPFQAIGGLNIYTTRLPSTVAGVFTVWMIYFVAGRLFNTKTGLLAAALLTLNPWHIQLSRWGHEGCIAPMLGLAPLALMLWAKMPISDNNTPPRPIVAAWAGALTGVACFGYHSVRLFIPVFLLTAVFLTLPRWLQTLKTRKGALAVTAFLVAFLAIFGQLLYLHIFSPQGIARHAIFSVQEIRPQPLTTTLANFAVRYIKHFGPDFLFIRGDLCLTQFRPRPNAGEFHWYMLPLMLLGLITMLKKLKSPSSRILLAFIIAYPVGDIFKWFSLHSLRSTASSASWLWKRNRTLASTAMAAFLFAVITINARYLPRFYGSYNTLPSVYNTFNVDLVEACKWLRPRLDRYDAVFCTKNDINMPYIISLVTLGYDPNRWFSEPREHTTINEFDYYTRYGKMNFMYGPAYNASLPQLKPDDRVLFIVRPGELDLKNPIHQILRPDGTPALWLCQQ